MVSIAKIKNGIAFFVKVTPRSGKRAFAGWEGDKLKVKLLSPPEKGEANKELIEFLCESLSLKKTQVKIVSGETSRVKKVAIECASADELEKKLRLL